MPSAPREGFAAEWNEYETSLSGPLLPPASDPNFGLAFSTLLIENAKTFPRPPEGVTTRDEQISDHVKVRIYQPPSHETNKFPVIVYYHGGGWASGNLDSEDHLCRTICGRAGAIIVSVEYRKFPHVKFPENIEDSFEGFQWAYDHATDLGADPAKYTLMGGSAGGGLAVFAVGRLIRAGYGSRVAGLLLLTASHIHPEAVPEKYQSLHTSQVEHGGDRAVFVTSEMSLFVWRLLGGWPPYDEESQYWFPAAMGAKGVEGFPPTWILDAEKDCMRDDGAVLEAELKDVGIRVKREVIEGMPHYYWMFPVQKAAEDFRQRVVAGLEWVLEGS